MLLHDYRSYIECQQRVGLRFIGTGISGGEEGARHGLPVPAIASALSYYDSYRSARLQGRLDDLMKRESPQASGKPGAI